MSKRTTLVGAALLGIAVVFGSCGKSTDPQLPQAIPYWTRQTSGVTKSLTSICFNGNQFAIVGGGGGADSLIVTLTSADGVSWSSRMYQYPPVDGFNDLVWTGSAFFAANFNNTLYTSPDGVNYSVVAAYPRRGLDHVAWSGSCLVAIGDSSGTAVIDTSTNGNIWSRVTTPLNYHVRGDLYCFGRMTMISENGTDSSRLWISDDMRTWSSRFLDDWIMDMGWSGSEFLALGINAAYTSADGVTWVKVTLPNQPATNSLPEGEYGAVLWANGQWIATGSYVTATSVNSVDWVLKPRVEKGDQGVYIWDLAAGKGKIVGIGGRGEIFTAPLP